VEQSLLRKTAKIVWESPIGSTTLFRIFMAFFYRVFGDIPLEIFLFVGLVRGSDVATSILFVGSEDRAHLFARLVYSRIEKIHYMGSFLPFQINLRRFDGAELIVVQANKHFLDKLVDKGFLLLPWVRFGLDLRGSLNDIVKRAGEGRRRDIKEVERLDYSYTVLSDDDVGFDFFYWKMYLPYAKNRFEKAAITLTYPQMKAIYSRNGGILLVKKGESFVSGYLFFIKGKTIWAQYIGENAKIEGLGKKMVGHALYFFLIQWAKTQHLTEMDAGGALPLFSDGIFTYKKEWGMFVKKQYNHCWALRLNQPSEAALLLLQQNPFIFLENGKLKSAVFMGHRPMEAEVERALSKYCIPELDSSVVIAYYQPNPADEKSKETSARPRDSENTFPRALSGICSLLKKHGYTLEIHERARI